MKNVNAASSPGLRFREAMREEKPLQIVGAINANHALLAEQAGFQFYLSFWRRRGSWFTRRPRLRDHHT